MKKVQQAAHSTADLDLRKDYKRADGPVSVPTAYRCPDVCAIRKDLWGTDWLFAATALVESYMVRCGGVSPADDELPRSAYHQLEALYEIDAASFPNAWGLSPNEFGYFGNRCYALAYLTRGDGSVPALSDPDVADVAARERSVTDRKPRSWMLTDSLFMENPFSFPDPGHQFALKGNMLRHGPAGVKMYYDPAYLKRNGNEWSYYCPDKQVEPSPELQEIIYHTVLVVGWDDAYDRTKFAKTPAADGAFEVMDGNGDGRGGASTFWVSYEDVEFGRDVFFIREMRKDFFERMRTIYQHDLFGCGAGYPWGKTLSTHVSGQNVFRRDRSKTERLESVGWYLLSPCDCDVYLKQGTKSETRLTASPLCNLDCGYYTYRLPVPVTLTEDTFAVRVEFRSRRGSEPVFVPLEKADRRTVHLKLDRGESFISDPYVAGGSPRDVVDINASEKLNLGHVCIKAFVTDESADALSLEAAYAAALFPAGSQGVSGRLPSSDATGVAYDWQWIEGGSEGDPSLFRRYDVQDGSVWVNDTPSQRRIVLSLLLSAGACRMAKCIHAVMPALVAPTVQKSDIPANQVYCTVSGTFPADGVRVRLRSANKAKPSEFRELSEPDYAPVSGGQWSVTDFPLLDSCKYDPKSNVYILTAEFLSSHDEVIARSAAVEIAVPNPASPGGGTAVYIIAGVAGLAALLGGLFYWKKGILCKNLVLTRPALNTAGVPRNNPVGNTEHDRLIEGQNHSSITLEEDRQLLLGEHNGTLSDTDTQRRFSSRPGKKTNDVPCFAFIGTISSTGVVRNCSFEVIVDSDCDPDRCIVAIAEHNEGLIENCTVTIRSGRRMKRIAGVVLHNRGTIRNCKVCGTIDAETACGVALTNTGRIEGCTIDCELSGCAVSGICDEMNSGAITDTVVSSRLSGAACSGFAARIKDGEITRCAFTGAIDSAGGDCGGIAGTIAGGMVSRCLCAGTILSKAGDCGGIAATMTGGTIGDCYAAGSLSGDGRIGGIAGFVAAAATVERCYAVSPLESASGVASGVVGVSTDGRVKACVAANPSVTGHEVYRTTKNRPEGSCVAMREMQTAAGRTFPDTGEQVCDILEICRPQTFEHAGWDLASVWEMTDRSQFPELRGVNGNPGVRHPYISIDLLPSNGRYRFDRGETVVFSGFRNALVLSVRWQWEDTVGMSADARNDDRWQVEIGKLVPGDCTITLFAVTAQGEVEFKLPVTVQ